MSVFSRRFGLLLRCGVLCAGLGLPAAFSQSLADRVLVVHNSHPTYATDSLFVSDHYRTRRGIPVQNRCAVAFSDNRSISLVEWRNTVRPAIRACIDSLGVIGRTKILYIVLSYQTPYAIINGSQGAGLDSHLSDLWDAYSTQIFPTRPVGTHRYFSSAQTQGNVYDPFLSLADFRLQPRATLIYSVWRLDARTREIAAGLVDKAVDTEAAGGLVPASGGNGTVYIDRIYNDAYLTTQPDLSFQAGDHNLRQAAGMASLAGLTVVSDTNETELGTSPSAATAPNAMLYSGWYSFRNYNDVFTWKPGAVGWHLDSGSASSTRASAPMNPLDGWAPNAVERGITITSGAVNEPFLEGLPASDIVFRHLLQGGNAGDAFLRATPWLRWMIVNIGDPLYRPFPGGRAPFNAAFPEASLRVNPSGGVVGGGAAQLTITLPDAAPAGGTSVSLSTSLPAQFAPPVPATVMVSEGQRSVVVPLTTQIVPVDFVAPVFTAVSGASTVRNSLVIASLLGTISAPSSLRGGLSTPATMILNAAAPVGGVLVTFTSSHPGIVQLPPSVTVPFGASSVGFTITTTAVAANTEVTLTAVSGPYSYTRKITITP